MRPDKFYNHRAGPASACCTGRGVVLQVAKRLEFWLFLLVHIGVSVAWRMGFLQNWADMSMSFLHAPWHEAGVVTLITVLSELAYLGRCYDIHVHVHDLTRSFFARDERREAMSKVSAYHLLIKHEEQLTKLAKAHSDCGSFKIGGDLGEFGKGDMQKQFEDGTYALSVGGLSGIVDSDSGLHLILRYA
ncbi:unnamed protein product [Prorocentrum cordatum]|uniref:Peptidyl-prolyl cis-trans isomerase n=1 Tax=Prorocentrum cordatum TaxID=2364126 RepID=A0ABN9US58_9DINO|nr:unnamed protein product [Polarella glacialis]